MLDKFFVLVPQGSRFFHWALRSVIAISITSAMIKEVLDSMTSDMCVNQCQSLMQEYNQILCTSMQPSASPHSWVQNELNLIDSSTVTECVSPHPTLESTTPWNPPLICDCCWEVRDLAFIFRTWSYHYTRLTTTGASVNIAMRNDRDLFLLRPQARRLEKAIATRYQLLNHITTGQGNSHPHLPIQSIAVVRNNRSSPTGGCCSCHLNHRNNQ